MNKQTIVLAGAAGDLGQRIAKALVASGTSVRAVVRSDTSQDEKDRILALGADLKTADETDIASLAAACRGAACVVSALNGLHDVIVGRQSVLLDAAVKAGVPRFISSDYSADFTRTRPGDNRNLDLRREFMARTNGKAIKVTSILNGAFLDMLGAEMPIIQLRIRCVLYWGDVDQPLDFTTKDNVATYVAAAATDDTAPRILRIAGDTLSAREIAAAMSDVTGEQYRTCRVGGIKSFGALIWLAKLVAPQPHTTFPPWQGMQYMRDMFSGRGKLYPLNNDRYLAVQWTSVQEHLCLRQQRILRQSAS